MFKALETDDSQQAIDEADAWDRTTGETPELRKFDKSYADRKLGLVNWR